MGTDLKNNTVLIQRPINDYQKTWLYEMQDDYFWKHQLRTGTRRVNKKFRAEFIKLIFISHTIIDIYVTTISVNLFYSIKCSRADSFSKFRMWWWFSAKLDAQSSDLGATKPPAHPEDWEGVSFRNVGKLYILTRLSARENFVEICRRESFKTYKIDFMFAKDLT
jgi:hypothetical protein